MALEGFFPGGHKGFFQNFSKRGQKWWN